VVPQQQWLTAHGEGLLMVMVASVFYGARLLHLPEGLAWAMQGVVAVLAVGAVVWAFWKRRDRALALSLLIAATFLVTPYILNYDMVVLGFVVALMRERTDNTVADHWLLIAVWTLPVAMMLAGAVFIPLAPMVLIVFAGRLIWRLAHSEAQVATPTPSEATAVAA
jgi:alpha-1,2-mannosyltransferase